MARPSEPAVEAAARRVIRGRSADERREQRTADLLDAALDLFAEKGYAGTSIEQICQRAYVSTKSFYAVFDGKEACYAELFARVADRALTAVAASVDTAPPGEAAAARHVLATFADALVEDPRVARSVIGESSGISLAIDRQRRGNRRLAAAFLESLWAGFDERPPGEAVPPAVHVVAVATIGGFFDLMAHWVLDAEPAGSGSIDVLVDQLVTFHDTVRAGLRSA